MSVNFEAYNLLFIFQLEVILVWCYKSFVCLAGSTSARRRRPRRAGRIILRAGRERIDSGGALLNLFGAHRKKDCGAMAWCSCDDDDPVFAFWVGGHSCHIVGFVASRGGTSWFWSLDFQMAFLAFSCWFHFWALKLLCLLIMVESGPKRINFQHIQVRICPLVPHCLDCLWNHLILWHSHHKFYQRILGWWVDGLLRRSCCCVERCWDQKYSSVSHLNLHFRNILLPSFLRLQFDFRHISSQCHSVSCSARLQTHTAIFHFHHPNWTLQFCLSFITTKFARFNFEVSFLGFSFCRCLCTCVLDFFRIFVICSRYNLENFYAFLKQN